MHVKRQSGRLAYIIATVMPLMHCSVSAAVTRVFIVEWNRLISLSLTLNERFDGYVFVMDPLIIY